MLPKNCWNCIHARRFYGMGGGLYDPPEPPYAFCKHPIYEELQQEYDMSGEYAAQCEGYSPVLIERCAQCKKEMNVPEHEWRLWVAGVYDSLAVCSQTCKEDLQNIIQAQESQQWEPPF